jgi:hypothetical protein
VIKQSFCIYLHKNPLLGMIVLKLIIYGNGNCFPMYLTTYTGGEFVLTEQIPRAQSKAIVLKPDKGECSLLLLISDL